MRTRKQVKRELAATKAAAILARFNEHGAAYGTVGYQIAKQYAVRGVNLLLAELPYNYCKNVDKEELASTILYYEEVKAEIESM